MNGIRKPGTAKETSERSNLRTLQALDQAAGGSGNIASSETSAATRDGVSGTDDARCEDTISRSLARKFTADDTSFRISRVRAILTDERTPARSTPVENAAGDAAQVASRADADIRKEIEGRLHKDPSVNKASIFVTVSHGRVLIEGSVENYEVRQRAEVISRQSIGVTECDCNLVVRGSS